MRSKTISNIGKNFIIAAACAVLFTALAGMWPASAATLDWDADGVLPLGGTGIWDTTNPRWTPDAGTNYQNWSNATPDSATFAGTAGTVTLGEPITAAALTFTTNAYIVELNGNNLTVNGVVGGAQLGSATVRNTSAAPATLTIGSFSTANNAFRVTGNTNLTLGSGWTPGALNDFTGTFLFRPTAAAGVILTTANTQLGSTAGLIRLDATLQTATINFSTSSGSNQFETFTRDIDLVHGVTFAQFSVNGSLQPILTGVISGGTVGGSGVRYTSGQGNIVLAGANTYSGTTLVDGQSGMLTLANNKALGASSGVTMGAASGKKSTLGFQGGINITDLIPVNLQNDSAQPDSGYGHLHSLSGANSFAGNVTWTAGQSRFLGADAGSSLTLTGNLGGVGGGGGITKLGQGTIVLSGANIFGTTNASTAVNATLVRDGLLRLDFNQASIDTNIINNGIVSFGTNQASELSLAGGTLEVKGRPGATNLQQFKDRAATSLTTNPGFTLLAGASAVRADQNGATSLTISLGQLSAPLRFVGSTVDFTLPTAGAILLPAGGVGTTDTILTANGAAFATVGGTDWAAVNASRNIVGGSSIGGFYTANTATSLSGNADMSADAFTTLGSSPIIASLRFNNPGARTIDATGQGLTTGGILVTPAVGSNASTITGGTLRGAATTTGTVALPNQDLVIIQNNTGGALTIGSQIVDNPDGAAPTAATGLTKSGPGTLILTGANTYTGETHLNGGVTRLQGAGALGGGKLFFQEGVLGLPGGTTFNRTVQVAAGAGTAQFLASGGFAAYGGDVTINLGGAAATMTLGSDPGTGGFVPSGSTFILGANDADGTVIVQNPIFLRAPNQPQQREIRVLDGVNPTNVDARLAGGFVGANQGGGLTKTGNGTLEIGGAAGVYMGPTIVDGGTLRLGILNAIPNTPLTIKSGTFDLNGFAMTASRSPGVVLGGGAAGTSSAITTGAGTFTLGTNVIYNGNVANDSGATISGLLALGTTTRTFTVHNSTAAANDLTVAAAVSGTGGVNKAGAGTMVLANAANSYTGGTTVAGGTLIVSGSVTGTTAVSVAGGILAGNGTINSAALVTNATGGTIAPGFDVGTLNTGSVAFTGGAFALQITNASTADQLNVIGSVSLNAPAELTIAVANPIPNGTSFIIVNNDAGEPVIFLGGSRFVSNGDTLDEGDTFAVGTGFGSQAFQISYAGGSGNDITLLAVVPEPSSGAMVFAGTGLLMALQRFRRRTV